MPYHVFTTLRRDDHLPMESRRLITRYPFRTRAAALAYAKSVEQHGTGWYRATVLPGTCVALDTTAEPHPAA